MKKNETKVVCPNCGTEFKIAEQTHVSIGVVIGKDSNLGTIYPEVEKKGKLPNKAADRIEALKKAGVDVSNLFAMTGSNGGEYVVSQKDGKLAFLDDDDPIFKTILEQGTIPNRKLFRRWVMAQMFKMLANESVSYYGYRKCSITDQIHNMGYDYQWKQLVDELYAQYMMWYNGDKENYEDRNRWFNTDLVLDMLEDYYYQVRKYVRSIKTQKCKGVPYKRIFGENIFVEDIQKKVYDPILDVIGEVKKDTTGPLRLYTTMNSFRENILSKKCKSFTQSSSWVISYKGAGAFFTMQNMIRFHGCRIKLDKSNVFIGKENSYNYLKGKAVEYRLEGWRMIGLLRKFLKDNNVDIAKKMSEWRKK